MNLVRIPQGNPGGKNRGIKSKNSEKIHKLISGRILERISEAISKENPEGINESISGNIPEKILTFL